MTEPTKIFDDSQLLDIISATRQAGMTAFLQQLIPLLLSEKFMLSDLLDAVANYLHEQGFVEAVGHAEKCAGVVKRIEFLKRLNS